MKRVLSGIFMTALAFWFGASAYFTIFAANELFNALPPDTAGQAVGALFPTFFALCTALSFISAIAYISVGKSTRLSQRWYRFGLIAVVLGFVLSAVNYFGFLPRIQAIEAKMGPISKAPHDALFQQFGMLHGISMLIQLIELVCAFLLVVIVSVGVQSIPAQRKEQ